jgi:hypothetical protein
LENQKFSLEAKTIPYMMGLGQGNRAVPLSWTQISAIMVTVFKKLDLGAKKGSHPEHPDSFDGSPLCQ